MDTKEIRVYWHEDMRPLLTTDDVDEQLQLDRSLIFKREGRVVGTSRTVMGQWMLLVLCDDNQFREVDSKKVKIENND